MSPPRREVTPPGRYLVAARSEGSEEEARGTARVLGVAPGVMRDLSGAGWPRIIGSRSTREDAESLVRVLTARGREAITWDSEAPPLELFRAERLLVEGGQLILERSGERRTYPAEQLQRVVDLRLRAPGGDGSELGWLREKEAAAEARRGDFPERVLLIVPVAGWSQPGLLSTRTVAVKGPSRAPLVVGQGVQQAAVQARALVPDKMVEMRTHAAALGVEPSGREPPEQLFQLLIRLPPLPPPPVRRTPA